MFPREGLVHHPPDRGVSAWIGHLGSPDAELGGEIVHVPERAGREEGLPDRANEPVAPALGCARYRWQARRTAPSWFCNQTLTRCVQGQLIESC